MIHGVGIDLIEVDRMVGALARTPALRDRLFTPAEQAYCGDSVERLAARFAAKEAVAKALGTGIRGFSFVDVEVVSDEHGRPSVALHRGAALLAVRLGVVRIHLSMSTGRDAVVAYAMAEGAP